MFSVRRGRGGRYGGYRSRGAQMVAAAVGRSFARKPMVGRKRAASKAFAGVKSNKKARQTRSIGDGVQWTRSKMKTGKKARFLKRVRQTIQTSTQSVVTRIRRVKAFDNRGDVEYSKARVGDLYPLPLWVFALNGQNSSNSGLNFPVRQLNIGTTGANDGVLSWSGVSTYNELGTPIDRYHIDRGSSSAMTDRTNGIWTYSNIKMNLWGAKSKPVRYTVEIVKVTDENVSPWNLGVGNVVGPDAQQAYSELLKHYTFNPISTINWSAVKSLKILKRFDIIIQPRQTSDGDQDSIVHQLNWDTTWHRAINFRDVGVNPLGQNVIGDDAVLDAVTDGNNTNIKFNSNMPADTGVVFVMLRMSDFNQTPAVFSETLNGSFDFDIRNYWRVDGGTV